MKKGDNVLLTIDYGDTYLYLSSPVVLLEHDIIYLKNGFGVDPKNAVRRDAAHLTKIEGVKSQTKESINKKGYFYEVRFVAAKGPK